MSNAFLHGLLKEEVYMAQVQGYVDSKFPKHVCLLHKAIYSFMQAPRAWFERFTSQLFHIGFFDSGADRNKVRPFHSMKIESPKNMVLLQHAVKKNKLIVQTKRRVRPCLTTIAITEFRSHKLGAVI